LLIFCNSFSTSLTIGTMSLAWGNSEYIC
jgi:hypothetical protein